MVKTLHKSRSLDGSFEEIPFVLPLAPEVYELADATVALAHSGVEGQRKISAQQAEIWKLQHDDLTGLWNRAPFMEMLQGFKGSAGFLLFADLKGMGDLNKKYGWDGGNQKLAKFGQAWGNILEEDDPLQDISSRLGGDEFGKLILYDPEAMSLEQAVQLTLTRIYEKLDAPDIPLFRFGPPAVFAPEKDKSDLLREADPKAPKNRRQRAAKFIQNARWRRKRHEA